MFINTRKESKIAAAVAVQFGFETLTAEKFYKRYSVNAFSAWSNEADARNAIAAINAAIRASR